jgi:hypothetical protein
MQRCWRRAEKAPPLGRRAVVIDPDGTELNATVHAPSRGRLHRLEACATVVLAVVSRAFVGQASSLSGLPARERLRIELTAHMSS